MTDRAKFVELMIHHGVLKFGEFTLKSGRRSPYFFNLGAIADGAGLAVLGRAYADAIIELGLKPDVLFGPAYKGIPIAVAAGVALHQFHDTRVGVSFNRKEAKQHGEGGNLVGHALHGRVVIVDDVMTAGTAVAQAADIVRAAGGTIAGVLVALDRCEQGPDGRTAVQGMADRLGTRVESIVALRDVIEFLDSSGADADSLGAIRTYQRQYCQMTA
ncbi:MAG: orotate phosphoribosyltransferase [Gammaproteobacteria bacterium]|nr:orotate phosphoribosyltransferase [Gammaproteobacteria bacterium]